ncbi:MAG TPA: FAD:protein FMN transferase [Candidatus Binatia bacterium]
MGTLLDITVYHYDEPGARRLLKKAFALAERLDGVLSNYKDDSEVSRLNGMGGGGRMRVSPDFYDFLLQAKKWRARTQGAFDPTIGPLLELWRSAGVRKETPTDAELQAALRWVGMAQVLFHGDGQVELAQAGARIDTGGLGKGYAVDRMVESFRSSGIRAGLVNFGQSSVYALGSPPGRPAWKLLLRFHDRRPLGVVRLKDSAFSASDALGRYFEIRGKRYGHLIDPRSGMPVTERVRASVVAPSATAAEALSKYVVLRGCGWSGPDALESRVKAVRFVDGHKTLCSGEFPLYPFERAGP